MGTDLYTRYRSVVLVVHRQIVVITEVNARYRLRLQHKVVIFRSLI